MLNYTSIILANRWSATLLAAGLLALGPGDRTVEGRAKIALLSKNRPEWVLLDLAVLGPLREELLFRGLLFGRLCRLWSPLPAYAASSGVFGLLHLSPDSVKVVAALWNTAGPLNATSECPLAKCVS